MTDFRSTSFSIVVHCKGVRNKSRVAIMNFIMIRWLLVSDTSLERHCKACFSCHKKQQRCEIYPQFLPLVGWMLLPRQHLSPSLHAGCICGSACAQRSHKLEYETVGICRKSGCRRGLGSICSRALQHIHVSLSFPFWLNLAYPFRIRIPCLCGFCVEWIKLPMSMLSACQLLF